MLRMQALKRKGLSSLRMRLSCLSLSSFIVNKLHQLALSAELLEIKVLMHKRHLQVHHQRAKTQSIVGPVRHHLAQRQMWRPALTASPQTSLRTQTQQLTRRRRGHLMPPCQTCQKALVTVTLGQGTC